MNVKNMWPALTAVLVAGALPAQAQTVTAPKTMTINAEVTGTCSLDSTPDIDLGQLTMNSGNTGQGAVNVTCTNGLPYDILATLGANANGAYAQLKGDTTGTLLRYNLYTDATHQTVWPQAAVSGTPTQEGAGSAQSIPVYLQIVDADLKAAKVDTYQDAVDFTVSY